MSFFLPKKPIFTPSQLDRFSNILDNLGQVFFGVMVLTPIMQGIDKTSIQMLVLGAIDVLVCWSISLILARRKDIEKHDI
jgi:hypothetical protein